MYNNNELEIPEAARSDADAFELIRVWIGSGRQHICLKTNVWDDPAAWGIMLADIARHVAKSYSINDKNDFEKIISRIKSGIDIEFSQ